MIEEVIQVLNTEQKPGKKGPYLEVAYLNEKGEPHKRNIFDQTLWNLFGKDLWVKWQLEKEGDWWNVKGAESVKEGIERLSQAPREQFEDIRAERIEKAVWWKQLGDRIGDKTITASTPEGRALRVAYFAEMFRVLDIKISKTS